MSKPGREPGARYVHAERMGAHLKAVREQRGLSLKEVAKLAGMTHQNISKIERGLVSAPVDTLARIAEQLGVTVALLCMGEGENDEDIEAELEQLFLACDTLHMCLAKLKARSRYSKTISWLSWLAATICVSRYSCVDARLYATASEPPLRLLVASLLSC